MASRTIDGIVKSLVTGGLDVDGLYVSDTERY